MPRISVRISKNRLPEIARLLPEASDVIVQRRGPEMVQVSQRHSRVDTGQMRDGWHWNKTGQGEGELVNEVPHTIHNEYGTRNLAPAPMARPAIEEVGPKIVQDFRDLERMLS